MIPYEELERALARWKARHGVNAPDVGANGVSHDGAHAESPAKTPRPTIDYPGHFAAAEDDTGRTPYAVVEGTGEIDLVDEVVETVDEV